MGVIFCSHSFCDSLRSLGFFRLMYNSALRTSSSWPMDSVTYATSSCWRSKVVAAAETRAVSSS